MQCVVGLIGYELVGLVAERAPLGVAQDDPPAHRQRLGLLAFRLCPMLSSLIKFMPGDLPSTPVPARSADVGHRTADACGAQLSKLPTNAHE